MFKFYCKDSPFFIVVSAVGRSSASTTLSVLIWTWLFSMNCLSCGFTESTSPLYTTVEMPYHYMIPEKILCYLEGIIFMVIVVIVHFCLVYHYLALFTWFGVVAHEHVQALTILFISVYHRHLVVSDQHHFI